MGSSRKPFCTYVLRSLRDQKRYTGFSQREELRLIEHNAGTTKSTKGRRPFVLTYGEYYETLKEARDRERYFETAAGRRFLDTIETPLWVEYIKNDPKPVAQMDTRPTG